MTSILRKIDRRYKIDFFLLLIVNIIETGIVTSNIYFEGELINSLVYKADRARFINLLILIIGLNCTRLILSIFMSRIQILNSEKINLQMNDLIREKLYLKNTLAVIRHDPVKLADRITEDSQEVINFLFQTINQIISIAFSATIILVYIFRTKSQFFLLIIIMLPLYSVAYLMLKPRLFKVSLDLRNIYNEYFSAFADWFSRYIEIKGNENYQTESTKWNSLKTKLIKIKKRDYFLNLNMSNMEIILQLLFQLILFTYGGLMVIAGTMTVGSFTVLLQYFNQLLDEVNNLFSVLFSLESFRAASKRIVDLLKMRDETDGTEVISKIDNLRIENFNIKFENNKFLFSNSISYSFINPGLYVITGKNGVGKSTLLRTISGLYDLSQEGRVLINGIELDKINKQELRRKNISFSFQDIATPYFRVKDYVGNSFRAEKTNPISASKHFQKVFYSEKFDLKKILSKKMSELSSGELQLVRLYVALMKKKVELFLLDEPLANIFPSLREDVMELLKEVAQDHLVIMISHDDDNVEHTNNLEIV